MKKMNICALALAACLGAFALPASADMVRTDQPVTSTAGPLGQNWKGVWDMQHSWNVTEGFSDVSISDTTVSYVYPAGGSWIGTPTQTYIFSTTAAAAGKLTLGIDLISNYQWDGSSTGMYIWQGNTDNRTFLAGATDGQVEHKSVTLDLLAGQEWGFLGVSGSFGDDLSYTGPVWGYFTITDPAAPGQGGDVPEPASLALLGLGMLGAACARRRKA